MRRRARCRQAALLVFALLTAPLAHAGDDALPPEAWYAARREALYRDASHEVSLARSRFHEARHRGDATAMRLWGGWYLRICEGRRLVDDMYAVYDTLRADLPPADGADPPAGLVASLLGMARFEIVAREVDVAVKRIERARHLARQARSPALLAEARLTSASIQLDGARAAAASAELLEAMQQATDRFQQIEARTLLAYASLYAASSSDDLGRVAQQSQVARAELKAEGLPWAALGFAELEASALARSGRGDAGLRLLLEQQQELARAGMDASSVVAFRVSRSADLGLALALASRATPHTGLCAQVVARQLPVPDVTGASLSLDRLSMLCRAAARDPTVLPAIRALEQEAASPFVTSSPAFEESLWNSIASAYALAGAHEEAYRSALRFRKASLRRVGQANEALRAEVESRYQLAAQRRENDHLRQSQSDEAQRRLVLLGALTVLVLALVVVGLLLRTQTRQRRRLARISVELGDANQRLLNLQASRNQLLAAACHDLRQPAHAIGLLSELLAHGNATATAAPLEELRRSSAVLADMLDCLIDMTQLESDRYEPRIAPVAMDELLKDAQTQFTRVAERKGLALVVDASAGLWTLTDRHLLRRMLFNLLSNAIKYTLRGEVIVRLRAEPAGLRLVVADTGVGIPVEHQQHVFSEFVRLDTLRDAEQGLGIGLTVVARAARLLGLSVDLVSHVGQGSVFSMLLPVAPAALVGVALPEGPCRGLALLVLEDDAAIRQAMREVLLSHGHQVQDFASLDALLADVDPGQAPVPDLVISDLHLAEADGLDAIARLRAVPGWESLPAILLTGDLAGSVVERAAAMGVLLAYKPLPARRLMECIARALAMPAERPTA